MPAENAADWSKWSRLSETLEGPRDPGHCTSCGIEVPIAARRWRECDDYDGQVGPILIFCGRCEKKVMEPHPRVYAWIPTFEPNPGTEQICIDCPHRRGLACTQTKANGGPGIKLDCPKPREVHLLCSPRSQSGWRLIYPGPVVACTGREVAGG